MKKGFSIEDLQKIPTIVWQVKMAGIHGFPIGASTLEEAITKYPEYFPEEVSRRKRWDAIPQSVHDAYEKEMSELKLNGFPKSNYKGIIYYILHPEDYREEDEVEFNKLMARQQKESNKIWNKHYKKYRVK